MRVREFTLGAMQGRDWEALAALELLDSEAAGGRGAVCLRRGGLWLLWETGRWMLEDDSVAS